MTVEFNDDKPAIEYIRVRGYASYSSMKNVRDCIVPTPFKTTPAYTFGKELHSRDLEKKKIQILTPEEEVKLKAMLGVLASSKVVQQLKRGAEFEVEFKKLLYGMMVLGYIDINGAAISDYKTCWHDNQAKFIKEMDFLQAALYTKVEGKDDFYYIGICKEKPHRLMIFNVNDYPDRLKAAHLELRNLLTYIKGKLDGKFKGYIYETWLLR